MSLISHKSALRTLAIFLALLITTIVIARFGVSASSGLSGSSGSASVAKAGQSSGAVAVRAAKRGNPRMNLQDGRSAAAAYKNATTKVVSNSLGGARPLSLASGDLNVDGYPDLVAGYASADGSFVTLSLGNPEAFAPTRPETIEAVKNGQFHDSFLPDVAVLPVPEAPEFLAVGDFDRDGRLDILTATRGNDTMYLALGDEAGFSVPQALHLPGAVTALVTGQTDNALAEVAVGIQSYAGSQVLVYAAKQSVLTDTPVAYSLPATATAIALGQFDESSPMDLAVAAGNEVLILHDAGQPAPDQKSAAAFHQSQIEHIAFSSVVTSVAVGDFIADRQSLMELAALGGDGTIHILTQGELDTRPLSEAEVFARRQRLEEMRERNDFGSVAPTPWRQGQAQSEAKSWSEVKSFSEGVPDAGASRRLLTSAKLATGTGEQLLMLDTANNQLHVVMSDQPAQTAAQAAEGASTKPDLVSIALDVEGAPVAALSMRLSVMALPGLVVLSSNRSTPVVLPNAPLATFAVDRADDTAAATACTGAANDCSLRGAVIAANANGVGADFITFNAGINPTLTISSGGVPENSAATGDLDINSSVTITGNAPTTTISTNYTNTCGDCKVFGLDQTGGFPGIAVSFSGVTVQNGFNKGVSDFSDTGGGIDFFLQNTGNVFSMSNCVVQNNTATGSAFSRGGGVNVDSVNTQTVAGASAGTVTFTNVTFTKNTSLHQGGGLCLNADKHDVTMTNCIVGGPLAADGNQSTDTLVNSGLGGGVNVAHSNGGTVMITGGSIQNNSAAGGGGLRIVSNPIATISNVNISDNTSTGSGGSSVGGGVAIVLTGVAGLTTTTTLSGCTISNNKANNGVAPVGGGVYFASRYDATVSNCTISGNSSGAGAGVYNGGTGTLPATIFTLDSNTSVSSNTATGVGGGIESLNSTTAATVLNGITIDSNTSGSGGDGIDLQGGTISCQGTINVNGSDSINIAGGTFTSTSGTLNLTGNFTLASGPTFTNNGGTFNFNGAGAQSINGPGSPTFNNLTVNKGSGTLTLGINTPVAGNLTVTAGTFDLGAFTANRTVAGGTLTVSNGATLKIGGTNTLPSGYTTHSIGATSTIEYSGSGQTVAAPLNSAQKYGNLTTSGSGTKTLAGATDVSSNLSIGAGTTLDVSASNFALNVPGNWSNNGTFNPRNGTVTFNGGAGQTISGTAVTTFNNLTIANAGAGVSLTQNETANGTLTLTNDLTTGANTLTQPSTAPASAGAADVVGNVKRTGAPLPAATNLTFGNPNNLVNFTAAGTRPTDVTFNLVKAAPSGGIGFPNAINRTYTISQTAGVGFSATLQLHYLDSELNGNTEGAGLNLWRNNGTSWVPFIQTANSIIDNWVSKSGVTAFSPWTLNSTNAPTAGNGTVSGRITSAEGSPVAGAVINLSGSQSRKTITDANGNYQFDNVLTSGFYTVTPSRANYNFSPASRSFSQIGNRTEAAFTGVSPGDSVNPLDTPEYFVRQQYVDILGREPDEDGFNYWSNHILACGGDTDCTRAERTGVASAFFIENEFRQSGAFIYNVYSGALGRRPVYTEYSADRRQVVGGATLEAQKQAFAEAFVARAEFVTRYQADTNAASFVDALLANVQQSSGADLSSQRDSLIGRYNTGASQAESRTLVLRDVTESAAVRDANYNKAFVLVEYFGYLHRGPDQGGYEFWLNVLNETGQNGDPASYRGMVCSFITSAEYQNRFSVVVSHSNGECGGQ